MRSAKSDIAIVALRVVLGGVVLVQSLLFLYGGESARFFASHGLPDAVRLILGWSEVAAALLFLLPPTMAVGSWALLSLFGAAILFHLVHGQFEVGRLFVYSAAVLVVLVHRKAREMNIDPRVS
jgi:hypothetical protein